MTSAIAAVAAGAGAIGLLIGATDFGPELDERLPFASVTFAAFALLVVVALPMAGVAVLASRRDHRAPNSAIVAGALLVGWIAIQLLLLRSFSWLQPACAALGAAVMMLGVAERKEHRCS
jgi:CHASE2 domain-containing sensor protein